MASDATSSRRPPASSPREGTSKRQDDAHSPATGSPHSSGEHMHRRIFLGPMPEKMLSHTEAHIRKQRGASHEVQTENDMVHILRKHAFRFFIGEGGKAENWTEDKQRHMTNELLKRWKEGPWSVMWGRQKHRGHDEPRHSASRAWVGDTFEVGHLLDVNIVENSKATMEVYDPPSRYKAILECGTTDAGSGVITGSLKRLEAMSVTGSPSIPPELPSVMGSPFIGGSASCPDASTQTGSQLELLRTRSNSSMGLAPIETGAGSPDDIFREVHPSSTQCDSRVDPAIKGKGKAVSFCEVPGLDQAPSGITHDTSNHINARCSPGGPMDSESEIMSLSSTGPQNNWGDVVLRDRMLVRINYTKTEIDIPFTETMHRTAKGLSHEDWSEFLVAWRKDSIELYHDYSIPGKEWALGHKHLSYIIPLKSSRTVLSLYSFVDLTFCISCPPAVLSFQMARRILRRAKEGTNIFVFKLKTRSRAYDWTWQLWRHLGGEIPRTIQIRSCALDMNISVEIPQMSSTLFDHAACEFGDDQVIALCAETLRILPDWQSLVCREVIKGKTLRLAWRADAVLDLIWLQDDVEGRPRKSAFLYGLPFQKETEHRPTKITLKNGQCINEPPDIEGYLDKIRPYSLTKHHTYVATHCGKMFVMSPHDAFPPSPPGLILAMDDLDNYAKTLRQAEVRRGASQILHATGLCDMGTIIAVRRARQLTSPHTHSEREAPLDTFAEDGLTSGLESALADDTDRGGEEYLANDLANVVDKNHLKIHRSFEILLNNGSVVRLEAYSCRVALEWVRRLRALVFYWKRRHRLDAREEIELAHARRPRLTPRARVCQEEEQPPDPPCDLSGTFPALRHLYNTCIIQGCSPIIKGGKIYVRRGLRGSYKLVQLILVHGHLVCFRITPGEPFNPVVGQKTSLLDAYICSGYFAARSLPKGEYQADAERTPRRYHDGLETDDRDEDMLFMVWYRSHSTNDAETVSLDAITPRHAVPGLSAKRKLLVFRTRSKLERDSWCWAMNCEIEKLVRLQNERERLYRESGGLL